VGGGVGRNECSAAFLPAMEAIYIVQKYFKELDDDDNMIAALRILYKEWDVQGSAESEETATHCTELWANWTRWYFDAIHWNRAQF